jgi:hypothetical protein
MLVLGGCAAAVPGYSPPPFKEKKKMTTYESGKLVDENQYEMSSTEQAMDCKRMTGSMRITISRLKDASFRSEPSAVASAAHKTVSPLLLKGSTVGADRQGEYTRERAKLDAYNRHLASKNCKTLDIDAELAKPPEPIGQRY